MNKYRIAEMVDKLGAMETELYSLAEEYGWDEWRRLPRGKKAQAVDCVVNALETAAESIESAIELLGEIK